MKRISSLLALSIVTASALSVSTMSAQQTGQQVRIGAIAGMNYNYLDANAAQFIGNTGDPSFASTDFSEATGLGLYAGIVAEYDFTRTVGIQVRGTYDERCVEKTVGTAELTPRLIYASLEPAVRINLSSPLRLHMLAGGSISFPILEKFDYSASQSEPPRSIESAEMNNVNDVAFGGWVGFGMDIALGESGCSKSWFVTPFVEGSYMYDQKNPDVRPEGFDNIWSTVSARGGIQVKLGL